MLRTHTCDQLRLEDVGKKVQLCGWVQRARDKGSLLWIDIRDRYGLTQLLLEQGKSRDDLFTIARKLGREFVIRASGEVVERQTKNDKMATGSIEVKLSDLEILNPSKLPPFLIEDETDGSEELRMKYRYLDLRRNKIRTNLELRHQLTRSVREYLDGEKFIEVETPVLIKSTPEGARDFVVPSRMNLGEFYALPQSPQTFKQLLMVSGFDRYYQIVKCFRDEDLRADRQPEFTQIDCEMSFISQDDVLETFEGLISHIFVKIKNIDLGDLERIPYREAIKKYGSDKPDLRFEMEIVELRSREVDLVAKKGFANLDAAQYIGGLKVSGGADFTRKQIDELTEWAKRPQIGAKGLIFLRHNSDGTVKSSIDKFYDQAALQDFFNCLGAGKGDLVLILFGDQRKTRKQLGELRLELGERMGLRKPQVFKALWVVDFPLLEYDEVEKRWAAMHHPFTSPKQEDMALLDTGSLEEVRANAYDLVINGTEIGGGSIRIFQRDLQMKMFEVLGFTTEEAMKQFGFLMNAFEYGAPPHGGIAFGLDRLVSILAGADSIRDFIAFPKNNSGRDVMIDSPSTISVGQLNELAISIKPEA